MVADRTVRDPAQPRFLSDLRRQRVHSTTARAGFAEATRQPCEATIARLSAWRGDGPARLGFRLTPEPAPLPMPQQRLDAAPAHPRPGPADRKALVVLKRLILILGSCGFAAVDGFLLTRVLAADGVVTPMELVTLALSVLLCAWLAFGFISASAGFVAALGSADEPERARRTGRSRTAVLMPTYNEDPGLVLAGVQAMAEEVRAAGMADECDFFILSDTRDEVIASAELIGFLRTRARLEDGPAIYYRRRPENIDRKAGNIADWVESHGAAYDYMLVLDADSLMSGEAVAQLVARMDREPGLGLLQTAPRIVNAATPFARLQQFASRLYGPVFARGQQWWSGAEGNYWGHNAIIRVAAFAASCRLPHLPGRRPFGGHIMSHDFVEAALLRRAGWAVRTIAGLPGSYEEGPPTLLAAAVRDRRWCQGNLQHAGVLRAKGLHWVNRLHLVTGILAYVAPVLWLAVLVTGAAVWPHEHLPVGSQPFRAMTALTVLSLGLLLAPKLMSLVLALKSGEARRGFGGALWLIAGVLAETLASFLTTPVTMVMQSVSVVEVLLGRDSGWSAQDRNGVELSHKDAFRAHGAHVVAGVLGAAGAGALSPAFLLWTSPVFLSLTLSAVISAHSSRPRRAGAPGRLFQTPEELSPPGVLLRSLLLREAHAAEGGLLRRVATLFPHPTALQPRQPRARGRKERELPMVA